MDIVFQGIIKKLTPTFGIIQNQNAKTDYFFHISNLRSIDQSTLKEGDIVSFELKANKHGSSDAYRIALIESVKTSKSKNILKNKFDFDDKSDIIIGMEFIQKKLNYQLTKINRFNDPDYIENEIKEILDVIDDFLNGPFPNVNDIPLKHINEHLDINNKKREHTNYWYYNFHLEAFAQRVIELGKIQVVKGKQYDFSLTWHQWKDNSKQVFSTGYEKGHFNYSFIDKGETEQTHVYSSPPPPTKWKISKIEQKNNIFYISSAPVNEIAQSSYVPSLPPIMNIVETAERIIDSDKKPNEWQREVDKNRIRKIQQFIEDSNNIIANTPMLFIKDSNSVRIEGSELIIDYSKFLNKQIGGEFNGKLIDRKKRIKKDKAGNTVFDDYRPLWLIDGQHRIKGINRSEKQQHINVPIIIFPHDFGAKATAKVFAEINTLQKKLNPLHELFMQHRFSIDHVNTKRKFRDYRSVDYIQASNENWSKDWENSRANHLSYEIAALLAQNGKLKERIQFLPQNGNSKDILVSADQWVNYSREWFYSRCYNYRGEDVEFYIVDPKPEEFKLTQRELFFTEINNYFDAWVETCNHKGWENIGHSLKWIEGTKGKGIIQKKSHFIILLELYDLVKSLAKNYKLENDLSGLVSKNDFLNILKVFKWVDWSDKELLNTYSGGGEKGRRSLEAWMADALIEGRQYSYTEIHIEDPSEFRSLPGRGICSYLSEPTLETISSNIWPTKNEPVKLISCRPFNARTEATWSVYDKDGENLITEGKSSVSKYVNPDDAEFILRFKKEMKLLNELTIQVEWKNAHARTGKSKITLQRP